MAVRAGSTLASLASARPVAIALMVAATAAGCAQTSRRSPTAAASSLPSTTAPAPSTSQATAPPTTAPAPPTTAPDPASARLQAVVDGFAARQAVPFSVLAVDRASGARASRLAGRQVLSASLYKLFVARELLRRVYAGSLDRGAPANDGAGRTVGECIRAMIVVSDDPCGRAGLRAVGLGALDHGLAAEGYVHTSLASPQRTSASDVGLFLLRARDGTLLGPAGGAATSELYGLLAHQQVIDRLPVGLPPGTPIAHKTGDRLHWAHDAGIVTTPRGELLLVVMTGPWPLPCCDAAHPGPAERTAFGAIAELGRRVYATVAPPRP